MEIAPDHRLDGGGEIQRASLLGDNLTIAQDHDAIGKPPKVSKAMRDVEDTDSLRSQAIDNLKKSCCFRGAQTSGWLVKNQDGRLRCDRARNGNQLSMSGPKLAKIEIQRQVETNTSSNDLRSPPESLFPDQSPDFAVAKFVQDQIFSHAKAGYAELVS